MKKNKYKFNNKINYKTYFLLTKMIKMLKSNKIVTQKIKCKFNNSNNKLIINYNQLFNKMNKKIKYKKNKMK